MVKEGLNIIPPYDDLSPKEAKFLMNIIEIYKTGKDRNFGVKINSEKEVIGLDLKGKNIQNFEMIIQYFDHLVELFPKLEEFRFIFPQIGRLPSNFNKMVNLTDLDLNGGKIDSIPENILYKMNKLDYLSLKFPIMTSLPEKLFDFNNHIRILGLSGNFGSLSFTDSKFPYLEGLFIDNSPFLLNLSDWIGNLPLLSKITFKNIPLKYLPDSFGNLQSLQKLSLHDVGLENLPESLGDCYRLKELDIRNCNHLTTLPDSIGDLHNLESLKIYGCLNLESIPDCIADLPQLKYVYFVENPKLDILVRTQALLLKKLETFNMDGCKTKWMNP